MEKFIEIILTFKQEIPDTFYEFLLNINCLGTHQENSTIKLYFNAADFKNNLVNSIKTTFPEVHILKISELENKNWNENFKNFFKSHEVGKKLVIAPPWEKVTIPEDKILIKINPEMAFGTGTHETTILCLKTLEEFIPKFENPNILDVGCGSGILSIAAKKLGANYCLGIDIDPKALDNANENLKLNNVEDVAFSDTSLKNITDYFQIVVANLLLGELMEIKDSIIPRIKSGGYFIYSGAYQDEANHIPALFENSLKTVQEKKMGDWYGIVFKK